MNLNFPARFLKKLEIYQQIRKGDGISKHKKLWTHESAYLQTAYEEAHQHLNNFQQKQDFRMWTFRYSDPGKNLDNVIGNLFWRGYLEIRHGTENDAFLLDRNKTALSSKIIANYKFDNGTTIFRISPEGLLVGEVLSEINNRSGILRFWNNYKYDWILAATWLVVIFVIARFIFGDDFIDSLLSNIQFRWRNFFINEKLLLLVILLLLPYLSRIYRGLYLWLESIV